MARSLADDDNLDEVAHNRDQTRLDPVVTIQAGLDPDRVIYVEAGDELSVLACFEEGLRHGALAAVVTEVARLSMTASRRLQLAAESSGTLGIALRRWRRPAEAADFGLPTAAVTRWRITAVPSADLPVPGAGRARWLVELMRVRSGEAQDWIVEACDEEGRLGILADLEHGSSASQAWNRRATNRHADGAGRARRQPPRGAGRQQG